MATASSPYLSELGWAQRIAVRCDEWLSYLAIINILTRINSAFIFPLVCVYIGYVLSEKMYIDRPLRVFTVSAISGLVVIFKEFIEELSKRGRRRMADLQLSDEKVMIKAVLPVINSIVSKKVNHVLRFCKDKKILLHPDAETPQIRLTSSDIQDYLRPDIQYDGIADSLHHCYREQIIGKGDQVTDPEALAIVHIVRIESVPHDKRISLDQQRANDGLHGITGIDWGCVKADNGRRVAEILAYFPGRPDLYNAPLEVLQHPCSSFSHLLRSNSDILIIEDIESVTGKQFVQSPGQSLTKGSMIVYAVRGESGQCPLFAISVLIPMPRAFLDTAKSSEEYRDFFKCVGSRLLIEHCNEQVKKHLLSGDSPVKPH